MNRCGDFAVHQNTVLFGCFGLYAIDFRSVFSFFCAVEHKLLTNNKIIFISLLSSLILLTWYSLLFKLLHGFGRPLPGVCGLLVR